MREFEKTFCWIIVGIAISNIINTFQMGYYTHFAYANGCIIVIFGLMGWLLITAPENAKKHTNGLTVAECPCPDCTKYREENKPEKKVKR